jgi:hypothetical protein
MNRVVHHVAANYPREVLNMTQQLFRYTFQHAIPIEKIEASLVLAVLATESLHGEAQVRLDAAHYMDTERRVCVIDAGTEVGRDLNRLLTGFLTQEFGEEAFQVERVDHASHHKPQETQI